MTARARTRIGLLALGLTATAAAVAAVAIANVGVYGNNFSKRADVAQVKKAGGGKRCERRWAKKSKRLRAVVSRGPATCGFRPPVEGDRDLPDHIVRVDGTIGMGGPKAARETAHLLVRARAGGGANYELRVYPRGGRFELHRRPDNAQFPVNGTSDEIDRVGRRNTIRLSVMGAEVRANVNGDLLAAVTDSNPGAVSGRRIHFGVGHDLDTTRDFFATFDRFKVWVPSP